MTNYYPYPLNPVEYYATFPQFLAGINKNGGDMTAVTSYKRNGEKVDRSYSDIYNDSQKIAAALAAHGIKDSNVAIVGENSYYWLTAYFGVTLSANVAVCVDIEESEDMLKRMIKEVDAKIAIVSPLLAPLMSKLLKEIADQGGAQVTLLVNNDDEKRRPKMPETYPYQKINDYCKEIKADLEALTACQEQIDPSAAAAIVFTSGTTSLAKGVMLSHRAILTNAADALAMVEAKQTCFSVLPFYHSYGMTCAVLVSLIGKMTLGVSSDVKTMLRDLEAFQPQMLIAVPLVVESLHKQIWNRIDQSGKKEKVKRAISIGKALGKPSLLLKSPMRKNFAGTAMEKLRTVICGAAYLAPQVAEDLEAFGILILQGYGISECSPLVSVNRDKSYNHESVGYIVPNFEVRIKNKEIQVKGKSLMNGYYNHQDYTDEAMDGKWFKTGDIGYIDKKNHLHITGRAKNLIVMNNGKKISPEEYEGLLGEIPLVKEVIAYGASSGNSVDDVRIAVMVYPDPDLTADLTSYEILAQLQAEVDQLNTQWPTYKQIQMINIRDREFSKTSTKKIKRKKA